MGKKPDQELDPIGTPILNLIKKKAGIIRPLI